MQFPLSEFTLIELDSGPGGDMCSKESRVEIGSCLMQLWLKLSFANFTKALLEALLGDLEEA